MLIFARMGSMVRLRATPAHRPRARFWPRILSCAAWAVAAAGAGTALAQQREPAAEPPAADASAAEALPSDAPEQAEAESEAAASGAAESQAAPEEAAPRFVTRFEAQIEMQRLAAEEQYAQAADIGAQLIPLTTQEFGIESLETASAYEALASVQSRLGEHTQAEANYLQALTIYREIAGSFDEMLIDPLLGLGDNYHEGGQYLNAVSAYNEARTVSRRVDGLLNEGQIVMLDRLTESFERLDQLAEAHTQQLEALMLVERNHPPASQEVFDAIYKYGAWLRSVHRYNEEREQYFRIERIVRDMYGDDSPRLVRPLRERAISFRVQGNAASQGISGLRDALAIVEAQDNPDPLMLGAVLRDIGDWDVAFGRLGTDGADYLRSWRALGEAPNGEQLRNEWYGGIEFVFSAPLSRRGLSDDPEAPRGRVLVRFDIDQYGRSENVTIVDSQPAGLKDEAVARHIRQSRFRPNISDGQLVVSRNRALDIVFRYSEGDEDED